MLSWGVGGQMDDDEIEELWQEYRLLQERNKNPRFLRGLFWGMLSLGVILVAGYAFGAFVRFLWRMF